MIELINAPLITGLKFRHFRGESDYASIAEILTASECADQSERKVSVEYIANAYQDLHNCDPYKDMIMAEVDGELIGYARGWWRDKSPSEWLYQQNGFLKPEWRRKKIGISMFEWMENRLREIAATHPQEISKLLHVNVTQYQIGIKHMLEHSDYKLIRYFYEMVRPTLDDILELPLPAGIEIRPVVPEHYPAIWKSTTETSQDEWGYTPPTDDDYQEWLKSPQFQPQLWIIAWDTTCDQIVGHIQTYIVHDENKQFDRKRGYTEGIGVDRAWRRRGFARAMISRSLQAQKSAGMSESALVADSASANSVTQLYESCGFKIVKWSAIYRQPI